MTRHLLFFLQILRLSKIRCIKLPSLSHNLQIYHLGNYFPRIITSSISNDDFHDYESSVPANGSATDEKSFAVNHSSNNKLELFINHPALLIFKKLRNPLHRALFLLPSTLNFYFFNFPSKSNVSNFHPIDNYIDYKEIFRSKSFYSDYFQL